MANDPTNPCEQLLKSKGLTPPCAPEICVEMEDFFEHHRYHDLCLNLPPLTPFQAITCLNTATGEQKWFPLDQLLQKCCDLHLQNPAWNPAICYCCCDPNPVSQRVGTPAGMRLAASLSKGAPVLAGRPTSAGQVAWSSAELGFVSALAGPNIGSVLVVAGRNELFCPPDQPILLADGRVTTANRLRLGDLLTTADGGNAAVRSLGSGNAPVVLHSLAVTRPFDGSLDGRLLAVEGLVVGDYELQLRLAELPAGLLAIDHNKRKILQALNPEARPLTFLALAEKDGKPQAIAGLHVLSSPADIPVHARSFFTPAQAGDVANNGSLLPISDPGPQKHFDDSRDALLQLYPDADFVYDDTDLDPTLYAYDDFLTGQHVRIHGGLARQAGLGAEGMAMALAWGIACMNAGKPRNKAGYSAVGLADLYAFETIGRKMWGDVNYLTNALAALSQWQALFALVQKSNAGGDPKDPIDDPSLDCRIQAVQSGIGGGSLPQCAGGQPIPMLDLVLATNLSLDLLQLGFDQPVDASTIGDVGNYTLDPAATIASAARMPSDAKSILVVTSLTKGQHYKITVQNLQSVDGGQLNPKETSQTFTAV